MLTEQVQATLLEWTDMMHSETNLALLVPVINVSTEEMEHGSHY